MELDGEGYTLNVDTVYLATTDEDVDDAFVGLLRNLYFDHYRFFDGLDRIAGITPGVRIYNTAQVSLNAQYPVTFRRSTVAAESYAAVSTLRLPGAGQPLSVMVRTSDQTKSDGLLAFRGGVDGGGDFLALELANGGLLRVTVGDGSGATATVVSSAGSLADDQWHVVDIVDEQVRGGGRQVRSADSWAITVLVDDKYSDRLALDGERSTLPVRETVYVGGVPSSVYRRLPPTVHSRRGFSGCLATFVVSGRLVNILNDATLVSDSVTAGCTGTSPVYCCIFIDSYE